MSSKNVDRPTNGAKGRCRGAWSMAARLTIFYTLSAAIILALATGFLYWVLADSLREEDNAFISDELATLKEILRQHPGEIEPLKVEVELEGAARRHGKYFARVLEPSEKIYIQSSGMSEAVPPAGAFPAPTEPEGFKTGVEWRSPAGRAYLLGAERTERLQAFNGCPVVQVALDVSDEESTLAQYRGWLSLVLFLSIVISAATGVGIARRGLRPLQQITEAAQRVTAAQLAERIGRTVWPKELQLLATAFDEMLGRLEDSFNRLAQFSADLAHELRTPINNLMGEAEVTLSRSRTPEEYRDVLESSLEEFGRLSRMIDSLLFLARSENAQMQIQRTLFAAQKEIRAVLDFYEALAAEQGVALASDGNADLEADVILFRRALSNLLANALHCTPRGGKVTVSARPVPAEAVEISVADTGTGVAPDHLPKIFDRFFRADPARSEYPQGTGLGLAIVKSIMELHGGGVRVRSEPGKGSTFTLRFPVNGNSCET